MAEYQTIIYETPEDGIARIWLNRPEFANAQNTLLLYELNNAFDQAMLDDDVKVVILAAKGKHFSSGHDLSNTESVDHFDNVSGWSSKQYEGAEAYYAHEKEVYKGFCLRWRDLPKPTIASVQGKAIAGGLMLVWPMDFVIAADNASFQDNTLFMGIPGCEYFAHVWELGMRKGKEFLLAGQPLNAEEACKAGMVNHVVPTQELEQKTLEFARTIADKPMFALRLAKESINAAFSAQGFDNVQRSAFNAHHLAHTHYRLTQDGAYIDQGFMERFRSKQRG